MKFAPLSVEETQETRCLPKALHFQCWADVSVTTRGFPVLGRTFYGIGSCTTEQFCFPHSDAGRTNKWAAPHGAVEDWDNSCTKRAV